MSSPLSLHTQTIWNAYCQQLEDHAGPRRAFCAGLRSLAHHLGSTAPLTADVNDCVEHINCIIEELSDAT